MCNQMYIYIKKREKKMRWTKEHIPDENFLSFPVLYFY